MKSGHGHLRASTALGASGDRRGGNRCGVFGDAKPGPGGKRWMKIGGLDTFRCF